MIGYWLNCAFVVLVYVAVYIDTLSYYVTVEALVRICICTVTAFHTYHFFFCDFLYLITFGRNLISKDLCVGYAYSDQHFN